MDHTEGAQPTAGQVRLSGAERRVLRDLAATADLPAAKFMERRYESSFRDFVHARDSLLKANFIAIDDTIPRITPAGRRALWGAS